jgi:hypothetical protein
VSVAVLAEHARVTLQAHAMRIFDVTSPDDDPAPDTLHFKAFNVSPYFLIHLDCFPPVSIIHQNVVPFFRLSQRPEALQAASLRFFRF